MHLRYDEDFVEEAVFLCASGRRKGVPSLQIARFNCEREQIYAILDPDERNRAFFRLHLEWFREWGMETLLIEPLKDFPLLPPALRILAFRKSRGKSDEGTELYVNEADERNGVVAMRPERLGREAELGAFMRHELAHLQDMVDPGFGYRPELAAAGPSLSQQRLARERYRLLWDVSIDGRLVGRGRQTVATKDQRWMEFCGAFAFWTGARQEQVFNSLWNNPQPTHRALEGLVCDPRQLQSGTGPRPGASCPLCGFPTFAWADDSSLTESAVNLIRSEFPHWTPEQGACARCVDIYQLRCARALSPIKSTGLTL
jgi:hypothetical protein